MPPIGAGCLLTRGLPRASSAWSATVATWATSRHHHSAIPLPRMVITSLTGRRADLGNMAGIPRVPSCLDVQCAFVKFTPFFANLSILGVLDCGCPFKKPHQSFISSIHIIKTFGFCLPVALKHIRPEIKTMVVNLYN